MKSQNQVSVLRRGRWRRNVSRGVLALALAGLASFAVATPATAAPTLTWELQTNACSFSWQDTDPATGIAYGIVEAATSSSDHCQLQLTGSGSVIIADVTVLAGPAVVYFAAAGSYLASLGDVEAGSLAASSITVTGSPALPTAGQGASSTGGCTQSLENRSVAGHLANYSSGWQVTTAVAANSCSSTVDAPGPGYVGTATSIRTQLALLEPFGIEVTASVTDASGAPITSASVGDLVTFDYRVSNPGTVPWTVTIDDRLPGLGNSVCELTVLPAGASENCTAPYTVTAADLATAQLVNSVTAIGSDLTRQANTGASATSPTVTARLIVTATPPSSTPTATATTATRAVGASVGAGGEAVVSSQPRPWLWVSVLLAGIGLLIACGVRAFRARRR